MSGFNIERLIPRYLLKDKDGYALSKAIERAFEIVAEAVQAGIDTIQNPEKMPEWRLDELAGELGCLYDYSGTLEQKRYWIANATYLYTMYGTPQAIINFLEGAFSTVEVEESWQYDGDPFHFRIIVSGDGYGPEKIIWAQRVAAQTKNVRSVLDGISVDSSTEIIVSGEADALNIMYLYTQESLYAGDEYGQELS